MGAKFPVSPLILINKLNNTQMINCNEIIGRYYQPATPLHHILITHSVQVAQLADSLCQRLLDAGTPIDADFVHEAAMLHDIGIIKVNAPSIHCNGTEPYICHGIQGRKMLESLGLFRHAMVCERHTGAGLSLQEIIAQQLPLPHRDMLPLSIEEKLVCYADKFFSKTHLSEPPKPMSRVREQMLRFGADSLDRFNAMASLFGEP